MKICIIANFYPPFFFGGERAYQREVEGLTRRGHVVTVITSSPDMKNHYEESNNLRIYRFPPFNIYPPYRFQNRPTLLKPVFHALDFWNIHSYGVIKNALQKDKPDVVYIHNFKGLSLAVFGAVKSLGLPSVFCLNDYSLLCPRASLLHSSGTLCKRPSRLCQIYRDINNFILNKNNPDLVVSPSNFSIDKLKAEGFFTGIRSQREVLGVELKEKKIEKRYNELNILYVGAISKHKGVHVLIDAFKRINRRNVTLHIVGKGPDVEIMKNLASGDTRITFHSFITDEKLGLLREITNIAVVPSIWWDMAQGVICESFSCGTPVIGSKIGGIPEFIESGYNGFLFEPGNSEELESILDRLADNPNNLQSLEEGAFKSARKYDIERHLDRLEDLFRDEKGKHRIMLAAK